MSLSPTCTQVWTGLGSLIRVGAFLARPWNRLPTSTSTPGPRSVLVTTTWVPGPKASAVSFAA